MNIKLKYSILIALVSFSLPSFSAVKMKWLGVGAILLDDGISKILFDPAFTKPSLLHLLNIKEFRSDETLVKTILRMQRIKQLDAVFVTHTHFDHVIDATMVAHNTKATLYADPNLAIIARAHDLDVKVAPLAKTTVGNFTVTPILRAHPKVFQFFDFLPGQVEETFNFSFYDYKVGNTWAYLVEHPGGTVLLDNSSRTPPKLDRQNVNVIIQSIASRKDDKDILDGIVSAFGPDKFIPIHFDNFFFEINTETARLLPGVNLDGLKSSFKIKKKGTEFLIPKFGKEIELF